MTALFDPLFPHSSRRATVRPLISDGKRKNHGENTLIRKERLIYQYGKEPGNRSFVEKNRSFMP